MKTELSCLRILLTYPMWVQTSSQTAFGCFNHKYLILVLWAWKLSRSTSGEGMDLREGRIQNQETNEFLKGLISWRCPQTILSEQGLEVLPMGSVNKILIDEWLGDLETLTRKMNLQCSNSVIRAERWEMLWSLQTLLVLRVGFQTTPLAKCELMYGDILNCLFPFTPIITSFSLIPWFKGVVGNFRNGKWGDVCPSPALTQIPSLADSCAHKNQRGHPGSHSSGIFFCVVDSRIFSYSDQSCSPFPDFISLWILSETHVPIPHNTLAWVFYIKFSNMILLPT